MNSCECEQFTKCIVCVYFRQKQVYTISFSVVCQTWSFFQLLVLCSINHENFNERRHTHTNTNLTRYISISTFLETKRTVHHATSCSLDVISFLRVRVSFNFFVNSWFSFVRKYTEHLLYVIILSTLHSICHWTSL